MGTFENNLFDIYVKYFIEFRDNNNDENLSKMISWFEKELHNIIYNEFIDYKYSIDIALKNNLSLSEVLIRKFIDIYESFKNFKIDIKRRFLNIVVVPKFVDEDKIIYDIFIQYLNNNYPDIVNSINKIILEKIKEIDNEFNK